MALTPALKLLITPIIFILIEYYFIQELFPLFSGRPYDADPSYQYLLNSLMLLNSQAPFHTDHPGTTVQVLMAITIGIKWLFSFLNNEGHTDDIFYSVLSNPESYLLATSMVLIILNACALLYLGKRVYASTQSLVLAALSQLSPFLYSIACPSIAYPSTESLLFFSSTMLLGSLAPTIFRSKGDQCKEVNPIFVGLACGFGLATKLNFAPLFILILLMKFRNGLIASITAVIAFLFFIAPAWPKLGQLYKWSLSLMTHEGNYGIGKQVGFFVFPNFHHKITTLFVTLPALFILILLIIFFLNRLFNWTRRTSNSFIANRQSNDNGKLASNVNLHFEREIVRIFFVIILTICVQILIVTKHFHVRYMLPVFPLMVIGLIAMLYHLDSSSIKFRALKYTSAGVVLLTFFASVIVTRAAFNEAKQNHSAQAFTFIKVQNEVEKYSNPIIIGAYGCILPACALSYGVSASQGLTAKMRGLLQNHYDLNIWNGLLRSNSEGWVPISFVNQALAKGQTILLATPTDYPAIEAFALDKLVELPTQSLYQVTGLAVPLNKPIAFNSAALKFENWSFAETNFRWSLGLHSSISFHLNSKLPIFNDQQLITLRLQFSTLGAQQLIIRLNDNQVFNENVNGPNIVKIINLPINSLKSGHNTLNFDTPNAQSPNAEDQRELAVAFQSLTLTPTLK